MSAIRCGSHVRMLASQVRLDLSRLQANDAEAFPAELPLELHNAIPEYLLVVDSCLHILKMASSG